MFKGMVALLISAGVFDRSALSYLGLARYIPAEYPLR